MKKVAIFVHAGEKELVRAIHGLLYADEIHAAGDKVRLIFDGEGTLWVRRFEDPSHPMNPLYKKVKALGVIEACEHCAQAFGVTEDIQKANIISAKDNEGHASIGKLISEDYQIITL
ncbi:DsrE family protein [Paenibacillus filicis]|uniref:DsrE family protein n=1 Tax=Paenibacillus gyeongsangnamensis TaxID=3388067 RepID=A0ABT4QHB0_9BACL|nr:DsrE family protein [Paenibacillus filicis]MCZ8516282.1 DsrE family protein [Paenibacillus filicis]